MARDVDILVTGGTVVTMDGGRRIIDDGAVAVVNGRIAAVGPAAEIAKAHHAPKVIDARGAAVLPGLVDLHYHTSLSRGVSDDLPLDAWLMNFFYPEVRAMTPDDVYLAALMSYCESIKSGTTCVNDMYRYMERCGDAAETIGIRAELSCLVADDSEGIESPESNERMVIAKHGTAGGRVRARFGVEWAPIISEERLRTVRRLADKHGVGIHIHLNESLDELQLTQKRHGRRPVELAHDVGILGPDCIAAHCVWLNNKEIKLLKETGTSVSHNPVSNGKLGSGISPVPEMLAAGVTVGLGHDSAVCNNARDIFETMKFAALIHRAERANAAVMPAATVLEMATINGARALGLGDEIGSLEPGKKADLIVLDLGNVHMTPRLRGRHDNLLSNIVYSGHSSDVRTSIIDGALVMEERTVLTVDEARLRAQVDEASQQVLDRFSQAAG